MMNQQNQKNLIKHPIAPLLSYRFHCLISFFFSLTKLAAIACN